MTSALTNELPAQQRREQAERRLHLRGQPVANVRACRPALGQLPAEAGEDRPSSRARRNAMRRDELGDLHGPALPSKGRTSDVRECRLDADRSRDWSARPPGTRAATSAAPPSPRGIRRPRQSGGRSPAVLSCAAASNERCGRLFRLASSAGLLRLFGSVLTRHRGGRRASRLPGR
jgi:hypothetical protein